MSEEKEAIQKLYKWHDSFAASPPDTPMQAVEGIIHSCQSWRDKTTELESRIEKCRGYESRLKFIACGPEWMKGATSTAGYMNRILDGKA